MSDRQKKLKKLTVPDLKKIIKSNKLGNVTNTNKKAKKKAELIAMIPDTVDITNIASSRRPRTKKAGLNSAVGQKRKKGETCPPKRESNDLRSAAGVGREKGKACPPAEKAIPIVQLDKSLKDKSSKVKSKKKKEKKEKKEKKKKKERKKAPRIPQPRKPSTDFSNIDDLLDQQDQASEAQQQLLDDVRADQDELDAELQLLIDSLDENDPLPDTDDEIIFEDIFRELEKKEEDADDVLRDLLVEDDILEEAGIPKIPLPLVPLVSPTPVIDEDEDDEEKEQQLADIVTNYVIDNNENFISVDPENNHLREEMDKDGVLKWDAFEPHIWNNLLESLVTWLGGEEYYIDPKYPDTVIKIGTPNETIRDFHGLDTDDEAETQPDTQFPEDLADVLPDTEEEEPPIISGLESPTDDKNKFLAEERTRELRELIEKEERIETMMGRGRAAERLAFIFDETAEDIALNQALKEHEDRLNREEAKRREDDERQIDIINLALKELEMRELNEDEIDEQIKILHSGKTLTREDFRRMENQGKTTLSKHLLDAIEDL